MEKIITAAQQRGSTATTRAGAWRYLRANLPGTHPGLTWLTWPGAGGVGPAPRRANIAPTAYRAAQLERSADGRARVLGYPPVSQDWERYCAAYNADWGYADNLRQRPLAPKIPLAQCLQGYGHDNGYRVSVGLPDGGWVALTRHEDVTWGKNRSRRYRQYPTSSTVTYQAGRYTSYGREIARHEFSRRGDWLGAVGAALGLPATARNAVSLSASDIVVATRSHGALSIHTLRTWGVGAPAYCAVYHGVTYHAATARAAVAGLRSKITADITASDAKIITLQLCDRLGFCRSGVRSFLASVGLPEDTASIRRTRLLAAIAGADCAPYRAELAQIGIEI